MSPVWIVAGAVALAAAALALRVLLKRRVSPEELERRRRETLERAGKLIDASLVDIQNGHLFYSYSVRGVGYTASQDVSALAHRLPEGIETTMGPVLARFDPRNPANSIVLSEGWSGFER